MVDEDGDGRKRSPPSVATDEDRIKDVRGRPPTPMKRPTRAAAVVATLLAMLAFAPARQRADGFSWSKCDGGVVYHLEPKTIAIHPDRPSPGHNVSFDIDATADKIVADGRFEIRVYWGFLRIYTEKTDICNELVDGFSCPISPGDVKFLYVHHLPRDTPRANLKAKLSVKDSDGSELSCLNVVFRVSDVAGGLGEEDVEKMRELQLARWQ